MSGNKNSKQKVNWFECRRTGFFLFFIIFCSLSVIAKPSGGPYGPIRQNYDLPEVTGKIYYVAPDGKAENKGETLDKPTTLEKAIEKVVTGDAIIMRGGTYRTGELVLNQGITIQPYADEKPVLKGTYVAKEWQDLYGLWKTSWNRLFPAKPDDWWWRDWHGRTTPLHRFNNDMVFVDGKFLQSAGWIGEVDENSYFINYDEGEVYIGVNPNDHLIEITAFEGGILRTTGKAHGKISDGKGPVIRGITFTQYARRAIFVEGTYPEGLSPESEHGKEVVGTTLEHCEISNCSRVAARLRGDSLTLRHCKISNTSTEGIYIEASNDVLLEKNIFTKNNIERITGYFPAAVKIFNQSYRVTCRDNLVIDLPYSNGIWYDVGNVDGVFIDNWVQDVGLKREFSKERFWPSDNGFFLEISKGVICAGNVFVNCDQGIYILNSSNARIYNNTLVNSTVTIGRDTRSAEADHFGWHPSTGPDVDERYGHVFVNNLLAVDENYDRPLFVVWQAPSLCKKLNKPQFNQLDYNVYVRSGDKVSNPLMWWSPAKNKECRVELESLEGLRKLHSEFSANSQYFISYDGPLFKSWELGKFELSRDFPGAKLPPEIRKLLGISENETPFVGAYPPK
ncbi:right-handed parallel beta-helix repeat-containing protein [candidate division WOR-3 bacterium]|nr:right-handed parallel beta-helix repeat-containing protein [candidate division WOR-3 bacterium]